VRTLVQGEHLGRENCASGVAGETGRAAPRTCRIICRTGGKVEDLTQGPRHAGVHAHGYGGTAEQGARGQLVHSIGGVVKAKNKGA